MKFSLESVDGAASLEAARKSLRQKSKLAQYAYGPISDDGAKGIAALAAKHPRLEEYRRAVIASGREFVRGDLDVMLAFDQTSGQGE